MEIGNGKTKTIGKPVLRGWLSFSGRRNRLSYFLCMLVWLGLVAATGLAFPFLDTDFESPVAGVIQILIMLILLVAFFSLAAQRVQDVGWHGGISTGLLLLLVFLSTVHETLALFSVIGMGSFWLAILFMPGTRGDNRYGPDPRERVS